MSMNMQGKHIILKEVLNVFTKLFIKFLKNKFKKTSMDHMLSRIFAAESRENFDLNFKRLNTKGCNSQRRNLFPCLRS